MNPTEYERLRSLFYAALKLPADEQVAYIEANTPGDEPVRVELIELLRTHARGVSAAPPAPPSAPAAPPPVVQQPDQAAPMGQVGIYRLLRELGRGGMGTVYLAARNDDVFSKVVALKVISAEAAQGDFMERFRQERQILASLDHANIARILDGGNTDDGRPFYVMEYVDGTSIDAYCERMGAGVAERVEVLIQVCDAVDYLHNQGIIHRDLKPGNILVSNDGKVKLLDFGIAKVQGIGQTPTGQPTMIMTPGYASPEQIEGRDLTKSSDIYSLGIILYKLLAGRLPFAAKEGGPDLGAQLSGQAPAPPSKNLAGMDKPTTANSAEFRKRVSGDLDKVVLTALQRDPTRRYATAQLFADDLRRFLEGRPVHAHADSAVYRFRKLIGRNRMVTALAALLTLAVGVGAWQTIEARVERARIETKQADLERFVSLLNHQVDKWGTDPAAVPVSQKLGDLQSAAQIVTKEIPGLLASPAANPVRVKQVVDGVRRLLDKADQLSAGQSPVRKGISEVYRQVGDFQSKVLTPQVADKREAIANYQRAAVVAASVKTVDQTWAHTQLSALDGRLKALGGGVDAQLLQPDEPTGPPASAVSPGPPVRLPAARTARNAEDRPVPLGAPPASPPGAPAVDVSDLVNRLNLAKSNADRARSNVETLRKSLAARSQSVNPDTLASMARVGAALEQAQKDLDRLNRAAAEDDLRRAEYDLRKVFLAVGN